MKAQKMTRLEDDEVGEATGRDAGSWYSQPLPYSKYRIHIVNGIQTFTDSRQYTPPYSIP